MSRSLNFCHYHPLEAARYRCHYCGKDYCGSCVDHSHSVACCHNCQGKVESLDVSAHGEPFWRRLKESFHYPVNSQTLVFLVLVSFLSAAASFMPLGFIWALMLSGALLKYCFSCLEHSAQGKSEPPDITEAYSGGVSLMLQLIAVMIALGAGVAFLGAFLGPGFAKLLGVLMILALPAVVINFAMTESLLMALNPLAMLRLVSVTGMSYGVLLGFILIMVSSVGLITQVLPADFSFFSIGLQSLVANYYSIVAFHVMGYMLFQYRELLGYGGDGEEDSSDVEERQQLLNQISVQVKEGDYEQALKSLSAGVKKFPRDKVLFDGCFDFLCARRDAEHLGAFTHRYLNLLLDLKREDLLRPVYLRCRSIDGDYLPDNPRLRAVIAQRSLDAGDFASVVRLINGLHKQHPKYPHLVKAYRLMQEALEQIPNMTRHHKACLDLIEKLEHGSVKTVDQRPGFQKDMPIKNLQCWSQKKFSHYHQFQ